MPWGGRRQKAEGFRSGQSLLDVWLFRGRKNFQYSMPNAQFSIFNFQVVSQSGAFLSIEN
jgi:hypothetical protein